MSAEVSISSAATPEDLARLRADVAARGQSAARALERHLARPRYRPAFTRIAQRAGQLAGYALIGHERLALGAAVLEAGRIEALATVPDIGDRGVFEALLGDCLRILTEEQLPLALVRGRSQSFAPFGFAPYHFAMAIDLGAQPLANPQQPMPRPATDADLEDLAALYESSYGQLPLAQIRTMPDWRFWLAGAYQALEDHRTRLVAYAVVKPGQSPNTLEIGEAAAADAGAARALCAALQARAHAERLEAVRLKLSPWHVLAQAALQLGGAAAIRAAPAAGELQALAGVVDLPLMLAALAPEFERRLARSRYAGWSGNLRVEIETERITLALADGHATVIDGSRPADLRLRQVSLAGLAQLLLGYRAAADLRASGDLACDDSALGLLDALFPVVLAAGMSGELHDA
jgi:predicted acetyltransferase